MDTGVPSLATFDAIIYSFLGVGIVTTALRLWTPSSFFKSLRADDVLAILATVGSILPVMFISLMCADNELGR